MRDHRCERHQAGWSVALLDLLQYSACLEQNENQALFVRFSVLHFSVLHCGHLPGQPDISGRRFSGGRGAIDRLRGRVNLWLARDV